MRTLYLVLTVMFIIMGVTVYFFKEEIYTLFVPGEIYTYKKEDVEIELKGKLIAGY